MASQGFAVFERRPAELLLSIVLDPKHAREIDDLAERGQAARQIAQMEKCTSSGV
jgi:hypothetical protein